MSIIKVSAQTNASTCTGWHSKVDPSIQPTKPEAKYQQKQQFETYVIMPSSRFPEIDDSDLLFGVQCLLDLKGAVHKSKIVGATRPDTSQVFESATVEIAALYYISYLFTGDWGHAGAAVLVDERGAWNTDESIQKAYKAYQAWFKNVKKISLKKARNQKLNPLKGSGVSWY